MSRKNSYSTRKIFRESLPILGAMFIAAVSVAYILIKMWTNKLDYEKWKDYEDCGI